MADCGASFSNLHLVADTVDRVDDLRSPVRRKLLAEPVDVYLNKVRPTIEMRVPDMFDYFCSRCASGARLKRNSTGQIPCSSKRWACRIALRGGFLVSTSRSA